MKKIPIIVILSGSLFSIFYASTIHPITKQIGNTTYTYNNYSLMAIGIAVSLFVGIVLLWVIKRNKRM